MAVDDRARTRPIALAIVQGWPNTTLQPPLLPVILLDVFAKLDPENQAYFRANRETRFGTTLEAFAADPEAKLARFRQALQPIRDVLLGLGLVFFGMSVMGESMAPLRTYDPFIDRDVAIKVAKPRIVGDGPKKRSICSGANAQ